MARPGQHQEDIFEDGDRSVEDVPPPYTRRAAVSQSVSHGIPVHIVAVDAKAVVRALVDGISIERLARGEATERAQLNGEVSIDQVDLSHFTE